MFLLNYNNITNIINGYSFGNPRGNINSDEGRDIEKVKCKWYLTYEKLLCVRFLYYFLTLFFKITYQRIHLFKQCFRYCLDIFNRKYFHCAKYFLLFIYNNIYLLLTIQKNMLENMIFMFHMYHRI